MTRSRVRSVVVAAIALVAGAARARADEGVERLFVETDTPRDSVFVHQRFTLRLRIGFDAEFVRDHGVATTLREMDVPLRVHAPWMEELAGAEPLSRGGDPEGRTLSLALGDGVVRGARIGDRVVGGRTFHVVELTRDFVARVPGATPQVAPAVRLTYSDAFVDDAFAGRRALDARVADAAGAPWTLRIVDPPVAGRPPGFTGAVGRFRVAADAEPTRVAAGRSLRLTLRIEGDGALDAFDTPSLGDLPGFHVYGALDDRGRDGVRRTVVYDLAPIDATVTEVPAVAFHSFDPGPPAGYRTARTDPVPITVVAGDGVAAAPLREREGSDAGPDAPAAPHRWIVAGVGAVLLGAGAWVVVRRRRPRADTEAERRATLLRAFRERAAQGEAGDAFVHFLAARLECSPAAVISPDLADRLVAAGAPADLARRCGALVERTTAARYGGDATGEGDAREAAALAEALTAAPARGA